MKRVFNISLVIIIFGFFGSLSCTVWPGIEETEEPIEEVKPIEQNVNENIFPEINDTENYIIPDTQTEVVEESDLIAVRQAGSYTVSRIYPGDRCGIVQLDKVMPEEVGVDSQFNYSIKVTNLTDTVLEGIVITEMLPDNFEFVNASPSAQENNNSLTWQLDAINPRSTRQLIVTGLATYSEQLRYSTSVQIPPVPAYASIEVIEPRLKLDKTMPSGVLLCDLIPVKYVVTNSGTGTVTDITVIDNLPSGLRTAEGKGELMFEVDVLGAGHSREFYVELRTTKQGIFSSKAVASSTSGLRAESEEVGTIVGVPVLSISKSGPETLYIGRSVIYDVIVSNTSDVPARDVVLEDTIPEGVTEVKATAGAKRMDSKLIWELGTIPPHSSERLQISYTPTKAGTLVNNAAVTAYCAAPVNDSTKTVVSGIPAVMLEVVDVEDPVKVGDRATYIISVTNQGSAPATNTRIVCILEDNVKFVSSAGSTTSTLEGNTLVFMPLANLAPKAKAEWHVVVTAVEVGDVRFKVIMNSDELGRSVEETEATHLYR